MELVLIQQWMDFEALQGRVYWIDFLTLEELHGATNNRIEKIFYAGRAADCYVKAMKWFKRSEWFARHHDVWMANFHSQVFDEMQVL
jgi:hypothetical protein